ncbi:MULTISPECIES: glycosyltransferase [Niastella]|uniref:Glycosyltransferase n=1 Tax=Niastella soli TaxID=2821487 RepID=A0ABS3YQF2_9BACT|nr:glycosyltransferase [Niastella soli]MBO9200146.1 glycosyltransferase [Niastella soli]
MAGRKEIGLIYFYNDGWIGGTYYVLNLAKALNSLPEDQKPVIHLVTNSEQDFDHFLSETNYQYLKFVNTSPKYSLIERIINKVSRTIFKGKNIINRKISLPTTLFPVLSLDDFPQVEKRVFWIPDFQEKYLPHFFSKDEVDMRMEFQKRIAYSKSFIIFSSNDALTSFEYFFPNATATPLVVPFAVSHPEYNQLDENSLFSKYNLPSTYFFSPNQFWAHKNHIVILKALKIIKDEGIEICIAFSGKEQDRRNPDYFNELLTFVKENDLSESVRFLGFIDRKEQLKLMSLSLAVIQPSKFEGWSTVIEDAKAMNKFVIASNISVNKEQIKHNVDFFESDNEVQLAQKLISIIRNPPVIQHYDYKENIIKFGEAFSRVIAEVTEK